MTSLSRLFFGDYDVSYETDLSLSEAIGRLVAATDQVTPLKRRGLNALCGYATTHEVVLWQDTSNFLSAFRPAFKGRFIHEQGQTHLVGRIGAGWLIKAWVSAPVVMTAILGAVHLSGGTVHTDGSAMDFLIAGLVIAAVFVLLRIVIRPGSMLTQPLQDAIAFAIADRGPNSSSEPKPLRGSA